MTAVNDLLYQVAEAATCLICARGANCSSPDDCFREAGRLIAYANNSLDGAPVRVTVSEQGMGVITGVTADALLLVALDAGRTVAVPVFDIQRERS